MRPLVRITQRLAQSGGVLVNVVCGRIGNRTVTVVVTTGDGYERRMRKAKIQILYRLLLPEAISHRWHYAARAIAAAVSDALEAV